MGEDIAAVLKHDPAARSRLEVVLLYSGLHAIWWYRIYHAIWKRGWFFLARALSKCHAFFRESKFILAPPSAAASSSITAWAWSLAKLPRSVTTSPCTRASHSAELAEPGKRHPTICDRVVIGGGAKILGNITVGENCRIGAGSVVLRDVPADSTVVGVPGHIVFRNGKRVVITDPKQINDPLSEALAAVATEVKILREQVSRLEGREHVESESLDAAIEMDYQI